MDNDHDTNLGWWTDKPERHDRNTDFAPMRGPLKQKEEPVWIKGAVVITIMLVFSLSLVKLAGLVP